MINMINITLRMTCTSYNRGSRISNFLQTQHEKQHENDTLADPWGVLGTRALTLLGPIFFFQFQAVVGKIVTIIVGVSLPIWKTRIRHSDNKIWSKVFQCYQYIHNLNAKKYPSVPDTFTATEKISNRG